MIIVREGISLIFFKDPFLGIRFFKCLQFNCLTEEEMVFFLRILVFRNPLFKCLQLDCLTVEEVEFFI